MPPVEFEPTPSAPLTPLDALLAEFRELADSTRMQGNYLEALAKHFFTQDATWGSQHSRVWLWQEWPGRQGMPDTGIDLVAERIDGGITAIQAKFFAEESRVQKSDLDSFFSQMGREPFTDGIVLDTSRHAWSRNALEALKNRSKPVRRVSLADLRHSNIDWSTYELLRPETAPRLHERKQLRPHQHEAVQSVLEAFANPDVTRGKIVMACGTGKTFTALRIAERVTQEFAGGASNILVMLPSLALLQQTLDEWSVERDPEIPFRAFAVCSDAQIGRSSTGDLTSVLLEDLQLPATTDPEKLARALENTELDEGMTVVFSTYQSIDVLTRAQQQFGVESFDLVLCDEAHRTTGVTLADEDDSAFVRIHDDNYVDAARRLYMTATPRIFNDQVRNAARERDAVLASMDDESLYGPLLYRLSFGEAVEKNLLTDYKVLVLGVAEDQVASSFQGQLADGHNELPLEDVAKLVGCWNGLAKRRVGEFAEGFGADTTPMRRAVAFAKDIRTSKRVSNEFPAITAEHLSNILNDDPTDDLMVACRHVDGTMNATTRTELLDWLKQAPEQDELGRPLTRILTNARCLSEGVDVPSLDAVLFLNPRKSQVDVVQAVGRVMRRAEGKQCGYIILPVAIPAGVAADAALSNNERYKVVWQVLQALRSHDERLDAKINQMALSKRAPETVLVEFVDLRSATTPDGGGRDIGTPGRDDRGELRGSDAGGGDNASGAVERGMPGAAVPLFTIDEWKDSVYAKLVKRVGDRMYWDDWAGDIHHIAERHIALIRAHLHRDGVDRARFDAFLMALTETLNPDTSEDEAIEMLAQHMITRPIFNAMFPDREFSDENPVSRALDAVLESFAGNASFEREREPLHDFYDKVTSRIRGLDSVAAKQQMLVTLYDRFFSKAFPKLADRMGIVFTPIEVVDYILRSADTLLRAQFGRSLSDEGVKLLEPFAGTGTFLTRLLQIGVIRPEDLDRKYSSELFANEIVLLSYYIAAINIESVYREVCAEQGVDTAEGGFPGISLVDTFAMDERDNELAGGVFPANTDRVDQQRQQYIRVIVMNPPYSVGQSSANDDNQNAKYPALDARIEATYVDRSTAQNKNGLYDSYYRALRWATDRVGDEGIVAFVSNSGFVDGNTADGVRLTWADEFSDAFVYNLRGNARMQGDARRKEAGNVFGEGSRTGIAITFLVKSRDKSGPVRVHYCDIGDYLTREEKLDRLRTEGELSNTEFVELEPNEAGDWINQRDERFGDYQPIGDPATKGKDETDAVFRLFSSGLKTSRDAWCYNFSETVVANNMSRMIDNYNQAARSSADFDTEDGSHINWNRALRSDQKRGVQHAFDTKAIQRSTYRPFMRAWAYFSRQMNDMIYQLPRLWPTDHHDNIAISFSSDPRKPTSVLAIQDLPDLNFTSATQYFPLYTWEPISPEDGAFNLDALTASDSCDDVIVDGYRRVDNITDATLAGYRETYADDSITKDDIFFYVYAMLHHPEYREHYEADLKKLLPRIPRCARFADYARIGRELAKLHVDYGAVAPHPSLEFDWRDNAPDDAFARHRITKLSWAQRTSRDAIVYNEYLTIRGIPEEANEYKVGGRSPLEWILDRYQVKTDKASGIVNDPNDWLREHDNPSYVVDLIASLVTLSLETQRLVGELPAFDVLDGSAT